ncbi:MAG: hypothetical protein WC951_12525 [Bacteroidales bacterium]
MPANQKGMHSGPIPTHRDRHCLRMVARHYGKPTYAFASVGRHYNLETLREPSHIIRRLAEMSMLGITPFGKFLGVHINESHKYIKPVRFCYYS